MAQNAELAVMDGTAQAGLVRRREVTPLELVDAAIERIERFNPALNAVVTPMFDEARTVARSRLPDGPFTGVPFLLKDLTAAYAGVRMTAGSTMMRDFVPDHDSEMVRRLKRAGLIILGKTNTPEFGLMATTEPQLFGPTRNPWDTHRTAGGSSGGSAAAVAARMVSMAHGSDGGGSIRIPSSCCGCFGLKPTRARNPAGPDHGDLLGGLGVEHAHTISVRDNAALLDATSGPDVGDPYWAPPPMRSFLAEVGADPGRLRIAFTAAPPAGLEMHPDCSDAVKKAALLCAELGHSVEEAAPAVQDDETGQARLTNFVAAFACKIQEGALSVGKTPAPDELETLTWAVYDMGRKVSAVASLHAVTILHRLSREIGRFFEKYDVWLTPTLLQPPVPLGAFKSESENPLESLYRMGSFSAFPSLCNVTGQPAMSAPLYWNAAGLPIGVHFAARFGDEATLFRLAAQLEEARPWRSQCPPVCSRS